MTRLEVLADLRDKVAVGVRPEVDGIPGVGTIGWQVHMGKKRGVSFVPFLLGAYDGSVDAALQIINKIGLACRIEMIRMENGAWLVNLGDLDSVENAILSRALLLATLAALIEKEANK